MAAAIQEAEGDRQSKNLMAEVIDLLQSIKDNPAVRVLIIRAEGPAFSSVMYCSKGLCIVFYYNKIIPFCNPYQIF